MSRVADSVYSLCEYIIAQHNSYTMDDNTLGADVPTDDLDLGDDTVLDTPDLADEPEEEDTY